MLKMIGIIVTFCIVGFILWIAYKIIRAIDKKAWERRQRKIGSISEEIKEEEKNDYDREFQGKSMTVSTFQPTAPVPKYCSECGNELTTGIKFCEYCGKEIRNIISR